MELRCGKIIIFKITLRGEKNMLNSAKIDPRINQQWEHLVTHFTPEYIETMKDKKEYVVGFGSQNKSFCYLVEFELRELGEIRGSTSAKFGLWYGTHGEDREVRYRATKQYFGGDVDNAFRDIKVALARLIREAKELKEFRDLKSIIGGMFKYKIIYLYNPKIMIPSFVIKDLRHFEEKLGLKPSGTFEKCQKQLLEYKKENKPELSNHDFALMLYELFGKNTAAKTEKVDEKPNEKSKKIVKKIDALDDTSIAEINEITEGLFRKLNKEVGKEGDSEETYVTGPQEKPAPKTTKEGVRYYEAKSRTSAFALKNANHQCENNLDHECFTRRSNGEPYTEPHHLIPICFQDVFDYSIDVVGNIVSLCSGCHNEIHYGKDADLMITKLYNERKEKLKEAGLEITLDELLDMYHKINK